MMKQLFLMLTSLFFTQLYAQAPDIEWQKSLGGSGSDEAYSIQQTSDGGYIVAGSSVSNDGDVSGNHGDYDCWIVKIDDTGAIQWQKSLGGSGWDRALSIQQTADGGYIMAGYSFSNDGDVSGNHGNADYWIVKLDNAGIIQWQKSLGGSGFDYANSIQQTADGGYIVAGYSESQNNNDYHGEGDCWIVKLDGTGAIQWQQSLGGSDADVANSIQQTADGGYIVAGNSYSNSGNVSENHGFSDYWIVKLDDTGVIQWQRSLGGSDWDEAFSIQQTAAGGYIVAGNSNSNNGNVSGNHGYADYWIVRLDDAGNIQWQKSLGGNGFDYANSTIQQTADGGYIVAGYSYFNDGDVSGNHGSSDYWIVKLAPAAPLPLRLIAFTGRVQNKANLLEWQTADEENLAGFEVERSADGKAFGKTGFVAAANTGGQHTYSFTDHKPLAGDNLYRLKMTDQDGHYTYSNVVKINNGIAVHSGIYPNPAKESILLSTGDNSLLGTQALLTDMKGAVIQSVKITGALQVIPLSGIPQGSYLLRLAHGEALKVVKE